MTYSFDLAFREHFKCHAEGIYSDGFLMGRLKVVAMAAGTAAFATVRTAGRIANLINEIAKVLFYSLASLFPLGNYGNPKRLSDHCKLLGLNCAALLALPLQVIVHSLAISVGVISPKAAYRMMQGATLPIAEITSAEQKIWQGYKAPETINKVLKKTYLCEVSCFLQYIPIVILGFGKNFHLFGANPTVLTQEQKGLRPILLFHGNGRHTNQSNWSPFLHFLKKNGNQRPVYTINLPARPCYASNEERAKESQDDLERILPKIHEIRLMYGKKDFHSLQIDMMGHSMGSQNIQELSQNREYLLTFKIHNLVTVGTPFRFHAAFISGDVCDITCNWDQIYPYKSRLETNERTFETGHGGIMYLEESLQAMQDFLNIVRIETK